ncbi:MAG: hypothetical protein ABJC79_04720 [Acidimicrobiia bacterium]
MATETESPRRMLGRWSVRALSILGSFLLVVASIGWWLDTRVIDDDGFADVVAQASQRAPVRDYIADQATLRLARTSNFVTAARPAVTGALSAAIATKPVEDAIRDFATRAHQQVFEARAARRVDIDAQQAATSVRSALQSINPALSKKLPANVLDASATISQNEVVDVLFRLSAWIWIWIPTGALGILVFAEAMRRAADRVAAVRTVGVVMAISGALLAGIGAAAPVVGGVVAPNDPLRSDAVSEFTSLLTGRLTGAGLALILIGLSVALAPAADGGDLGHRWGRLRAWVATKRTQPRWRFVGGVGLVLLAVSFLTRAASTARTLVSLGAFLGVYLGVVVCLRAAGILHTDHTIRRLRRRWIGLVAATMMLSILGSAAAVVTLASASTSTPKADEFATGCNGYFELCAQPMDQIVWPASHNAMSSSAYNFLGAEHTITIPEQLNAGARFLMLDVYYGYDDNGLVRTNLAGGVDRRALEKERGKAAVDSLRRVGALTGAADTSGHKQELYFCHDLCELGAVKAVDVFRAIDAYLERNLTDMLVLDFEDYVQPKDLRAALEESGLWDRVRTVTPEEIHTVPLGYLLARKPGAAENPRRVITTSEKHGDIAKWLPATYSLFEETPYTFTSVKDFSCAPKRGKAGNPMFLINHWLRPDGPPDPAAAGHVNSRSVLLDRFRTCAAARERLPDVLAVDFTEVGSLYSTVRDLNGAIAKVTGVTYDVDRSIKNAFNRGDLTEAQAREIRGLHRLPSVSQAAARRLLGTAAQYLTRPTALDKLEQDNEVRNPPSTGLPRGPEIPAEWQPPPDTTTTTKPKR